MEAELKDTFKNDVSKWLANTKQFPAGSIQNKNPNQIWLLWNDESTPISRVFNKISNFFNWTMSFKTDAEVYEGSYGFFQRKKTLSIQEISKLKDEIYFEQFTLRKNAILWFVSNCKSKKRIDFALEISKHYPVVVYGKCDILEDRDISDPKSTYPYLERFHNTKCLPGIYIFILYI